MYYTCNFSLRKKISLGPRHACRLDRRHARLAAQQTHQHDSLARAHTRAVTAVKTKQRRVAAADHKHGIARDIFAEAHIKLIQGRKAHLLRR